MSARNLPGLLLHELIEREDKEMERGGVLTVFMPHLFSRSGIVFQVYRTLFCCLGTLSWSRVVPCLHGLKVQRY